MSHPERPPELGHLLRIMKARVEHGRWNDFAMGFVNTLLVMFFTSHRHMVGPPAHSGLYINEEGGSRWEIPCFVVKRMSPQGFEWDKVMSIVLVCSESEDINAPIQEMIGYLNELGERLSSDLCQVHGIVIGSGPVSVVVPGPNFEYMEDPSMPKDMRVEHPSFLDYLSQRASMPSVD